VIVILLVAAVGGGFFFWRTVEMERQRAMAAEMVARAEAEQARALAVLADQKRLERSEAVSSTVDVGSGGDASAAGEEASASESSADVTVDPDTISWKGAGNNGGVAAGGAGAVAAGMEILTEGGNAADSAAATILALSVTDSTGFCFGGEVPILVYDAKRKVVEVIAGQGVAPRLATLDYFMKKGGIPKTGIEPATVPAALDAVVVLLDRYGTMTFARCAAPALAILDRGQKPWHAQLAVTIRRLIEAEASSPDDRSRGLRRVADEFYRGGIARQIDAWSQANGGLIRYVDLATHATVIEDPVSTDYRGYSVHKCGAWTQGPYMLQTLRLLEGYDLAGTGHNRPQTIHTVVEAMKLALADRDVYYADPRFVDVPLQALLSQEYAAIRRPLIDLQLASKVQRPGNPRLMETELASEPARFGLTGTPNDTTTCVTADRWGNMVVATPSGWDGVLAGDTGVWLGSRLQSLNSWAGHPNCIEPGKRPRITLTPTLVLKDGAPFLGVSVAGGDGQDQAALQMVLDAIDFGMSPEASVSAFRFGTNHHLGSFGQTAPELGSLLIYPEAGDGVISDLAERGHQVKQDRPPLWAPCVIRRNVETGLIEAAGDPKAGRHAAAY
jgi:gamma-glutamyltranspeptidase/glutathione hydrolase